MARGIIRNYGDMQTELPFADPAPAAPLSLGEIFAGNYAKALEASGAVARFESEPTFQRAEELTLAMYDALHEAAPEGAKVALMYSGGKDSSAALHYFVESLLARVETGKRYVSGMTLTSSTQHEFSAMAVRQEKEIAAINKWGIPYGFSAELVKPADKNTVMVELLGNGLALPPRAKNDKVALASVSNWCVFRVKADLLEAAVQRAAEVAPFVIQILGGRNDESTSRNYTMTKYSAGMPRGLTRLRSGKEDEIDPRFVGMQSIGHFTGKMIRDFVHNRIPSYRPLGNLELEQIYRDMSTDGGEATECSIQRTADGGFGGGCSNLATGVRSGCQVCLKSQNAALESLAKRYPSRYAITYRLQQRINAHQDKVHARPIAVKAAGLTPDTCFPKGFTFTERYKMLVILLAAEIVAGERQLSDSQLAWIERRWHRHGVLTVTTADARRDAQAWLDAGTPGEPTVFFEHFGELAGEFTECLGEGMSLGAYAAFADESQEDLNLAHLLGLGITGTPIFPRVMSYVFEDRANPDRLMVAITDEPAVMGARTQTGLLNGISGATLKCVGVRHSTESELQMADGRHLFYEVKRSRFAEYGSTLAKIASAADGIVEWSLGDLISKDTIENAKNGVRAGISAAALESLSLSNQPGCGLDFDPLARDYLGKRGITELQGKITDEDVREIFSLVAKMVEHSEGLKDRTTGGHHSLLSELQKEIGGDWSLLNGDNDRGKKMRSEVRSRLKRAMFGSEDLFPLYRDYIDGLREMTNLYRAGKLNTPLAVRVAYIVRTSIYCEKDAEEYTLELLRLLAVKRTSNAIAA